MPSVDNRVVEMRFDNKDFESGVSTSLSTIDKLKKSLNFKEASKGFDELDRASKKVDFSSLADAIDVVTRKFSPMGVIADQVLRRIGDAVADVEHKMIGLVKGMSVDQISAGWTKLNQKTQSVQTIVNATGLSIEEVNKNLDRLMWYSDETSFGFTDMTSALETMTAKGGKLENLIPMLMGFGNAVAYAGKSSAEFKHGIQYSLTQAYSLGYMGTMDWRTLQTRGIGSKQLQDLLLKWARKLGTGDYAANEFSQALTDKIFTTEVMEKALSEFAEMTLEAERLIAEGVYENATEAYAALSDQFDDFRGKSAKAAQQAKSFQEVIDAVKDAVSTGWMVTFEHIFGNLTEQTELWSWLVEEFLEVFAYGAESRNTMLEEWHNGVLDREAIQAMLFQIRTLEDYNELVYQVKNGGFRISGYDAAIEALTNLWGGLKDILFAVKAAWNSVIPPATAEQFVAFTVKIRDVTASFREMFTYVEEKREEAIDPLLRTLGLLDDTVEETSESVVDNADTAISSIDELAQAVIRGEYGNGQARFDALTALGVSWKLVQNRVEELMGSSYRYVLTAEEEAEANAYLAEETEHVAEATEQEAEELKESSAAILAIQGVVRGLAGIVSIVKQTAAATWKVIVKPALKGVLKLLKPVFLWLSNTGNKIAEIAERWKETGKIEQFLTKVTETFKRITAPFVTFSSKVKEIFDRVKQSESFSKFVENLGKLGDALKDIGGQVGEKVLSLFDKLNEKSSGNTWVDTVVNLLTTGLDALNKLLDDIIPKLQQIDLDNLGDFFDGFSIELGNIQHFFENPATFLTNLFSNFDPLSGFDDSLDSFFGGITEDVEDVGEAADGATTGVLGFTDAISSLLGSFNFSDIDFASGVNAIIEMFSGLGESLKNITSGMKVTDVIAVLGVLSAVGVASAFKKVGKAAATTFGAITGFVNHIKRRHAIPMLLQIAIAVVAVAGAFMMVASIPADKMKSVIDIMIQIFISLASLVVAMTIFGKVLGESGGKGAAGLGIGLLMLAGSFLVIAYALTLLSGIKTDGLIAKIGIIGLVLLELAVISRVMTKGNKDGKGAVRGALSMVLLVGAVWLLLQVLKKIENISAEKILVNLLKMQPIIFAMLELAVISRMAGKGNRGLSMILLVGSIWVMAKVLESLNNINISSSIIGKLAIIEGALLGLAIIARIMSGSSEKTSSRIRKKDVTESSKTSKNAQNIGWQILEMAAAIYVIAMAMEKISALKPEDAKRATAIILYFFGAFAVIIGAMALRKEGTKATSGFAFLAMAASIFILIEAMNRIISMIHTYDKDEIRQAVAVIEAFVLGIGAAIAGARGVKAGGAVAIYGMVLVVAAIAGALHILKDIPVDQLINTAEAIGIILLSIAGSLRLISNAKFTGKQGVSNVAIMLIMLAAVGAVFWALSQFKIDADSMLKQAGAISAVLLALSVATLILSKAKFGALGDVGKSIAAMTLLAVLLESMVALLALISNIPGFDTILNNSDKIFIMLTEFVGIMAELTVLAAGLTLVGMIPGGIVTGIQGIGELALLVVLLEGMVALLALITNISGFDTVLTNSDKIFIMLTELTAVLYELAGLAAIMSLIGPISAGFYAALGPMAILLGAVTAIMAVLTEVADLLTNGDADKMARVEADMDLVVSFLEHIGEAIGSFISGIGVGLSSGLPEIGSNLGDFGTNIRPFLDTVSGITSEMVEGAARLFEIMSLMFGTELKGAFDSWLSGIFGGEENDIESFGDDLVMLFTKMSEISTMEFDAGKVTAGCEALEALMGLELPTTDEGLFDKIKAVFVGSDQTPEELFTDIQTLFDEFLKLSTSDAVTKSDPDKVIEMASAISAVANIDFANILSATSDASPADYGAFGYKMKAFGEGLGDFYDGIKDIKTVSKTKLDNVMTLVEKIAAINDMLPNEGGRWQKFVGEESDMGDWSKQLRELALGLLAFYVILNDSSVDWEDTSAIDGAIKIASALAELNNALPSTGGTLQEWIGSKQLAGFYETLPDGTTTYNPGWADQLAQLALGLKRFYQTLTSGTIDWTKATNDEGTGILDGALKIADFLAELNNAIPKTGGLWQALTGEQGLDKFGEQLMWLGYYMSMFAGYVKDITDDDVENVERVKKMIDPFIDAFTTINDDDSFLDILSNLTGTSFSDMGSILKDLGDGFSKFHDATAGITDWTNVETATANLDSLATSVQNWASVFSGAGGTGTYMGELQTVLDQLSEISFEGLDPSFEGLGEALTGAIETILSSLQTGLDPVLIESLTTIGESAGTGLATGLSNKKFKVQSNAQILKNAILTKFTTIYTTMYNIGVNAGQGLIDGMNAKTIEIKSAAEAWGTAISETTSSILDENSPSRVMRSIGQYAGEGLALGITDMQSVVEGATSNMTLSSINTARDALRLIATAIDSDIEMDPTIRPVMDLSNLRYGAAQASSIMDRTFSTRLGYSMASQAGGEFAGAKNAATNSRREQSSNYTTAFREVRADLHELKDTIADMQVVLNTGETIGALRRPMDSALGKSARYSNRRI